MNTKKEKELFVITLIIFTVSFLVCTLKCVKRLKRIWKSEENIQEHDDTEVVFQQQSDILMWPNSRNDALAKEIEDGIRQNYLLE